MHPRPLYRSDWLVKTHPWPCTLDEIEKDKFLALALGDPDQTGMPSYCLA